MSVSTRHQPPADALGPALDSALLGRADRSPSPDRVAALRERILEDASSEAVLPASETDSSRRPRAQRWLAAAAVGAVVVTGLGVVPGAVAEAEASQVLTDTAAGIRFTDDLVPGPGQYIRVDYRHTQKAMSGPGGVQEALSYGRARYLPADPGRDAVDVPDPTLAADGSALSQEPSTSYRADAMGPGSLPQRLEVDTLEDVPRDPDQLIRFFRDRYHGGSASRDENLFVQLTDTLREPGLPADLRRGLVAALAQAPGVRVEEAVTLSDGRTGVGVSRAEVLRMGAIEQMVLDPTTGQVIGERDLVGFGVGEFGTTEVVSESTTRLSIVDEAPRAQVHIDDHMGPNGEDITHLP